MIVEKAHRTMLKIRLMLLEMLNVESIIFEEPEMEVLQLFNSINGNRTTPVGCRGGNRYVEGDLLTFGYLMLDGSLGYPYFRLFNGNP